MRRLRSLLGECGLDTRKDDGEVKLAREGAFSFRSEGTKRVDQRTAEDIAEGVERLT